MFPPIVIKVSLVQSHGLLGIPVPVHHFLVQVDILAIVVLEGSEEGPAVVQLLNIETIE